MKFKKIFYNTVSELEKIIPEKNGATLEACLLIEHVFGIPQKDCQKYCFLNPEKELSADKIELFYNLLEQRVKHRIPLQYLTNKAYFMGEEFLVNGSVLIPRPETELLVNEVLNRLKKNDNIVKIADVGTGSGCITCMLAKKIENAKVFSFDISKHALKIAKLNAQKFDVRDKIEFWHADLFGHCKEKFDIIVSNPPYISVSEKELLQEEVRLHEPHNALFVEDKKGIAFYKRLLPKAFERLTKKGLLAVEIGIKQSEEIAVLFKLSGNGTGFKNIKIVQDYNKIERVIIGEKL